MKHMYAWEMTQKEFTGIFQKEYRKENVPLHKQAIQRAIAEGKDVPKPVLADYPELTKRSNTMTNTHNLQPDESNLTTRASHVEFDNAEQKG